jgi:uncharacterized protein YggE
MNGLRIFLLFVGSVGITSTLLASAPRGSVVLDGYGSADSPPELVSLSVHVTSMCYESSREAGEANAALANRVLDVLQGFKFNDRDQVVATGGANVRQTETTYTGTTNTVLCELKWRAENVLTIKMAELANLTALQDQMVAALVDPERNAVRGAAITYAEVGKPEFGLYPETSKKLKIDAQALAYRDARSQFDGLMSLCSFRAPHVVSIAPPSFVSGYKSGGIFRSGAVSPVIPDVMAVEATLTVKWEFSPSSQCSQGASEFE